MESILGGGNLGEQAMGKPAKICKPNYEENINKAKDQFVISNNLLDALYGYLKSKGMYHPNSALTTMIGELELESRQIQGNIDMWIELLEKE